MSKHKVFQIYYNNETRISNDLGFKQLNNMLNPRPDWSEYWPIRNFFQTNEMENNVYYGFFSPKFYEKTKLKSDDVYNFINQSTEDVISFSPYFDQASYALNIFEQAVANHIGIREYLEEIFRLLDPNLNVFNFVMPASRTIFCNYFVAKKDFWQEWFNLTELLFNNAEMHTSPIRLVLNADVIHSGKNYPVKVFAIERIVSYLLQIKKDRSVKSYNPFLLPFSTSKVASYRDVLISLNALKEDYFNNGYPECVELFLNNRLALFD